MLLEGMHNSDVPYCAVCDRYPDPANGVTFHMPHGSFYGVCDACRIKGGDTVGRCAVCGEYITETDGQGEVVDRGNDDPDASYSIHANCYDPAKHAVA